MPSGAAVLVPSLRLIPAAILAALAVLPAPAAAAGWSVRTLPVPPAAARAPLAAEAWQLSGVVAAPRPFRALGLLWHGRADATLQVRTARAGGRLGPWRTIEANEDGPDGAEARRAVRRATEPLWVGRADRVQVRTRGGTRDLRVVVIDPGSGPSLRVPLRRADPAGVAQPAMVSRAAWGADESLRGAPRYAPAVRFAVVHHTAGSNGYAQADAPAVVRSIYLYHTRTLGWSDIGYQFLVDRFGTIYEGRAGGVTRPTIGAHVYGFNTGSFAVSVIGDFDTATPSADVLDAVARLLAWRLDVAHLDPLAQVRVVSLGGDRYPAGVEVTNPMIAGHRDYGATACPGANLYAALPALRSAVAAVPGLRIWDPHPAPAAGALSDGPVHVTARLSASAAWRVSILDAAGTVLASGSGLGTAVDYTWPGSPGLPTASLSYRVDAGDPVTGARPATGRLDGRDSADAGDIPSEPLVDLALKPRVVTPNGDGAGDTAVLTWRQGTAAHVSAYVDTPDGTALAVADAGRDLAPGSQQLVWAGSDAVGTPLPSGHYSLRLVLQPPGLPTIEQRVPVDVRRGVAGLAVTRFISPNGDGRGERAVVAFGRMEAGPIRVRVVRGGATVATLADLPAATGPQRLEWDGAGLPDGLYRVLVDAPGAGGTLVLGAKLTVDRRAPTVHVVRLRRRGRVVDLTLRFSEQVVWRLQSKRALLRRGERAGRLRLTLPRSRLGRTMTLYLRDRAGTPGTPRRLVVPG